MCDCLKSLFSSPNPNAGDGGPNGTDGGGCADGGSPPCCVPIQSIKIISVKFLTDHALLKDYTTNWDDGGSRFPKPEWTPAQQYPVSHTMDKEIQIEVEYAVLPANACEETGDIRGEGPGGIVFDKTGVKFKPGTDKQTLSSGTTRLPQKIQELNFAINWSTKGTSASISPTQTVNTTFVTMGTPTTPRWPGVTLKRMRHAVAATGAANSLNPHDIVRHVMSRWGNFNLNVRFSNEWELADDKRFPPGSPKAGQLIGADCQTIVRHVESVIKMVGCPGTSQARVVWAKPSDPTTPIENDLGGPDLNNPNIKHPLQPWFAFLKDGNGDANAFEACLKFTYGGRTVYYAGGVGPKNNADEVLHVFASLSWFRVGLGGVLVEASVIQTY
jgi:hypothetical protein